MQACVRYPACIRIFPRLSLLSNIRLFVECSKAFQSALAEVQDGNAYVSSYFIGYAIFCYSSIILNKELVPNVVITSTLRRKITMAFREYMGACHKVESLDILGLQEITSSCPACPQVGFNYLELYFEWNICKPNDKDGTLHLAIDANLRCVRGKNAGKVENHTAKRTIFHLLMDSVQVKSSLGEQPPVGRRNESSQVYLSTRNDIKMIRIMVLVQTF
jgi:hypothetical protein